MRVLFLLAAAAFALVPVTVPGAAEAALIHNYVEDFTTDVYCDTLNTTAEWNTAAGTVGLPPFTTSDVGLLTTSGHAQDVEVWGDMLVVADGDDGVHIIDVSDPSNPTLLGTYNTSGTAREVEVDGDVVYVADDVAGIVAIDITDPASPAYLGGANTPGSVLGIALNGDYLYVADGTQGLKVYDVSSPASPSLETTYFVSGTAVGVDAEGDYAYYCYGPTGVVIVDVSDPTSIVPVATLNTPGSAFDVTVVGCYAYIADSASGLQIADVSDPASPTIVGALAASASVDHIDVDGPFAYVANGVNDLWIVDVSDPAAPVSIASHSLPGASEAVAVDGALVYVANHPAGVSVVEVAQFVGPFLGTTLGGFLGGGVHAAGTRLHVGANAGMRIYDTADPAAPALLGSVATAQKPRGIDVVGRHAFAAVGDSGLQVIDVGDPASPTVVGSCRNGWDEFSGVDVVGDFAYVTIQGGLVICDVHDPDNPAYADGGLTGCLDFAVAGDHGYYVRQGLPVVRSATVNGASVSDLDEVDVALYPTSIAVAGDMAYVIGEGVMAYISVSDPGNLLDLDGYVGAGYPPLEMEVVGDRVFVAARDGNCTVVSTLPSGGFFTGPLHPHTTPADAAAAGDYLFVTGELGLSLIEIMQRALDIEADATRSLDIAGSPYTIRKAMLATTQADSIAWELSADGGVTWQDFEPDGAWYDLATPGVDLRWRSTHSYRGLGVDPACSGLSVDWLYDFGVVDVVSDVPNDQGRQARLSWTRSAHDFVGDPTQVTAYAVYRRIDEWARGSAQVVLQDAPDGDRLYPPGDWEFLVTVPACCEDAYATIVPTVCDSTVEGGLCESVFFVRALTAAPGVHFDSPPDSGYSVDNLAPSPPRGLLAEGDAVSVELAWDRSEDEDFDYYAVYRSTDPEFSSPELLGYTSIEELTDNAPPAVSEWWYRVTATDFAGNESDPSDHAGVSSTGVDVSIDRFHLAPPIPNPMSGETLVRYAVPNAAGAVRVTIGVYDAAGRLVRRLVDESETPGTHEVRWDGGDTSGRAVASGVYLCRMESRDFEATQKVLLIR